MLCLQKKLSVHLVCCTHHYRYATILPNQTHFVAVQDGILFNILLDNSEYKNLSNDYEFSPEKTYFVAFKNGKIFNDFEYKYLKYEFLGVKYKKTRDFLWFVIGGIILACMISFIFICYYCFWWYLYGVFVEPVKCEKIINVEDDDYDDWPQ